MLSSSSVVRSFSRYVTENSVPLSESQKKLQTFLYYYQKILILTGAGVSTDSGIPDYRSEDKGMFVKTSYKPIQYSEFVKSPEARKRYWARNYAAWPRFSSFTPNNIHFFIASLQGSKTDTRLITQNVDGLHSKAGSSDVLELHGNAYWVRCTSCQNTVSRYDFQKILEDGNPGLQITSQEIRPDADVEIPEECIKNFVVPSCEKCNGVMKPTIVFFGQSVPEKTAKKAENYVDECDAMLILGTSLSTLSSFRLVEQAYCTGKYLFLVNHGPTRADSLVDYKTSGKISDVIFNVNVNEYTN